MPFGFPAKDWKDLATFFRGSSSSPHLRSALMSMQIHPLLGRTLDGKRRSCVGCRRKHRSCDLVRPKCGRCVIADIDCVFETPSSSAAHLAPLADSDAGGHNPLSSGRGSASPSVSASASVSSRSSSSGQSLSLMDGILLASEQPFAEAEPLETRIEDPDQLSTYADFSLVCALLYSGNGYFSSTDFLVHRIVDRDSFLADFFAQPAPLRHALCALAAYTAEPPLPIAIATSYFTRAKKALFRCDRPNVRVLEAVVLITTFTLGIGQPSIGKPFYAHALRIMLQLNLHIDPDELPGSSQMSDNEKAELRMLFWRIYYHLTYAFCITDYTASFDLRYSTVKRPPANPQSLLMECNFVIWHSILYIKKHLRVTPESVEELFSAEADATVLASLDSIPLSLLLIPDLQQVINSELRFNQYELLLKQINSSLPSNPIGIFQLSVNYHAILCLLLRPRLFLTGFISPNSPILTPINHALIQSALAESVTAARRIVELCQLSLYSRDVRRLPVWNLAWMRQVALAPALFEAAVVLYFATCRTRREWRPLSPVTARECLTLIERTFQNLSAQLCLNARSERDNMMTPLLECVAQMLREMDSRDPSPAEADLERIMLEMKVVSLDAEDVVAAGTDEPWVYLSLLGIDVNERVRWNGPLEDGWREFWRNVK
ncbi:hypothetical protein BC830DRAFT_543342 [Chytriomyces sp. MP71]|nr:hypothetical protein BC830DRAFT_543342 [Chytriomyces sp. MP71]